MVKKGQRTNKKKYEFFFNFNQLRRRLNSKQKEKLIKFLGKFRTMFLTVKQHLFQVNKMYDLMEQEYKKFQKDLFKNDEYLSGPNQHNNDEKSSEKGGDEFLINDDIMKQILDEGIKDEKQKEKKDDNKSNNNKDNSIFDKELLEKYDVDLGKDFLEKENEIKNNDKEENGKENEKKENIEYAEKFFEWRKKNI